MVRFCQLTKALFQSYAVGIVLGRKCFLISSSLTLPATGIQNVNASASRRWCLTRKEGCFFISTLAGWVCDASVMPTPISR